MLPPRPYTWLAVYRDGELLYQVDPYTQVESSSEQWDRPRLAQLLFYGEGDTPLVVMSCTPGLYPFYRRRVEQRSDGATPVVGHLLGGWVGAPGLGQRGLLVLEPCPREGRHAVEVVEVGEPVVGHRWLYPVEPLPCEATGVGADRPS